MLIWLAGIPRPLRAPPSRCSGLVALTDSPAQLGSLRPGDVLKQCEVKSSHRDKLFLSVPVVREGRRGMPRPLSAQLNLPSKHPAAKDPAAMVGKRLNVYVRRANVDDGTLQVSLFKFDHLSRSTRGRLAPGLPLRLEELATGQTVRGVVLSCHAFGAFVEVGVSRPGRRGRREPVDALLPLNQLGEGIELLEETRFATLVWPERRAGDEDATRRLRVGSQVVAARTRPRLQPHASQAAAARVPACHRTRPRWRRACCSRSPARDGSC